MDNWDYLKNPSHELKKSFCLGFLWIHRKTGRQNWRGPIFSRLNLVKHQCGGYKGVHHTCTLLTIIQLVELGITYFYYFPIISIILACCFNSFRRRQIESESEGLDSQDPKVWRCYYYGQFRPTIISHQKDRTWNKTSKRKTLGTKIFDQPDLKLNVFGFGQKHFMD